MSERPDATGGEDASLRAVAAAALALVSDGMLVGLGTGRAAAAFIDALGARAAAGMRVRGVPTSNASAAQARALGIPLVELDGHCELDLTVDGADEVAPNLDLVKGWGGALVRERIVAAASQRQVILVGREKLVRSLGERGRIPVEVVPFACGFATRRIRGLGLGVVTRHRPDGTPFVSDNHNFILDVTPSRPLVDGRAARELEAALLAIAGIVDTGLFLGTAARVLVGAPDGTVEDLEARA